MVKYLDKLPKCLSYLEEPYLSSTDEEIIVGLCSSEERNGIKGVSQIYTALVPLDCIDEVLKSRGGIGIGYRVNSSGPFPFADEDREYSPEFWIKGTNNQYFKPLVVGWDNHNRTVMIPDNGFLMTYGLTPRFITDHEKIKIMWDDLSKPVYDVVSVKPLSKYSVPNQYSGAEVRINRKYAQDFASLTKCALVAVFYEERRFRDDQELHILLGENKGVDFELIGKRLRIFYNTHIPENPYQCFIWGCRLILEPSNYPISDEKEPELIWPGDTQIMTMDRAMRSLFEGMDSYIYTKDEALIFYEKKSEFEVNPEAGYVSYNGQWSFPNCHRLGRDFIAYEIKKLYEGCPPSVIEHLYRFAVEKEVAEKQQEELGNQNIGSRAKKLIDAYLSLIQMIADMGNQFRLVLEDSDVGSLSKQDVEYHGWWQLEDLKPLGWIALPKMSEADFLARCKQVYKLIEKLKEKPLRRILTEMEVPKAKMKDGKSLKLLSLLIQVVYLANNTGLNLRDDIEQLCQRLEEEDLRLDAIKCLFALNTLRQLDSHAITTQNNQNYDKSLETFMINRNAMSQGWGQALDQIYDRLTDALLELAKMGNRVLSDV